MTPVRNLPSLTRLRATLSQRAAQHPYRDPAFGLIALWLILLAVFFLFPSIDLGVTQLFFVQKPCPSGVAALACGDFPYGEQTFWITLRQILQALPYLATVLILYDLVMALQHHGATYDADKVRRIWIVLATLLAGPVLIVNVWLKATSGRPRPADTILFGGDLPFVPAGSFQGLCQSNCSFVSGEAAGAGWLICLVILLPFRRRAMLLPALVLVSIVGSGLRIAFGRHFLSDVVLAWLSSLVVFVTLLAITERLWPRKSPK